MQQAPQKHGSPVTEISPISSQTSSPDSQRRSSRQDSIASTGSSSTPQTQFLQKTKELREQQLQQQQLQQSSVPSVVTVTHTQTQSQVQISNQSSTVYSPDKPPIPPRGNPPPVPQRQISSNESVQLRKRQGKETSLNESTKCTPVNKILSLTDPNSNYGNLPVRPHSHQLDFANGSSNEQWNQPQFKMGKYNRQWSMYIPNCIASQTNHSID